MTKQALASRENSAKEFRFLHAIEAVSILTAVLLFAYSILFLTPSFTELITKNTEDTAVLVGTHIKTDVFPADKPFARNSLPPGFEAEIKEIVQNFNLMKVKVFAPDGETIFSTEAKDNGVMNEHDYFHKIVSKGKPYTKVVQKDSISLEGQQVTMDVVETYVPAMAGDTFLGAFEIYLDITSPKAKLARLVAHSNRLLQVISAGLLIAMLFIARRAKTSILARLRAELKIIEQSKILEETNKDLSILNEISAIISHSIDLDRLLLPAILDTLATRFSAFSQISKGGIFLLAGDKLVLTTHMGHDDEFLRLHQNITINDCLCGKAARTGQIIFSENSDLDAEHTLCAYHGQAHGHVIIPLVAQDKVVGVLYLYTEAGTSITGKEHLLQSIGQQIGLAINNVTLYQQTKELALYDQLTGLPNRRSMEARLDEAMTTVERYARPLSLAMIDIDYFKNYNDTMGHAAGDRILADVAAIIRKEIREADFAARYGGEEFLVILAETSRCGACIGVERIRRTVEQQAGVTISIGVTEHRPGVPLAQLLKEADNALYQAKKNGKNRVEWADAIEACHE